MNAAFTNYANPPRSIMQLVIKFQPNRRFQHLPRSNFAGILFITILPNGPEGPKDSYATIMEEQTNTKL
ncbi:MAG: hypothetical protein CVV25_13790 [Ignavibacteriae bacterium HGW-Ignavibacteriae-4]|jgi:hypothetical protein|nr:MAG: hypothetical protein CVV25_13790 [Ignavibacteriae bacterium HGW-Ignavibacteriae-4]